MTAINNTIYTIGNLLVNINDRIPTAAKVVIPTFAVMAYGFVKFIVAVGLN